MAYHLTRFEELTIGQTATLEKTITQEDMDHFIAITGDENPLHVDDAFARQTFFGQKIAHGMLSAALFSTLVGMHLPGIGAIYKSQTLTFLKPVFINDTVTARFEIMDIDPDAEEILIKSWIENQHGQTVIDGQAIVSLLRRLKI
jgi:3-hydroxybutyryl-CoA dehydratase